jgi:sec-independent protein translocase protein TatC
MFGTGEMLVIAIVAIIVVDPRKLPDLMKGLGKAINEFKTMSNEVKRTIERESEVADFEKRKAEAEEQLFGKKGEEQPRAAEGETPPEAAPPEATTSGPIPAEAAPEQAAIPDEYALERAQQTGEPQPEDIVPPVETPEHVEQPPVDRLAALEAEKAEQATEVPFPPVQPEGLQPEAVQPEAVQPEQPAEPDGAEPPATVTGAEPPATVTGAEPPAPVDEPIPPAVGEPAAPPAEAAAAAPPASPPPPTGDDAVGEGQSGRMSLFGHLQDLRKRLTRSAIAVLVGFLACYAFAGQMLKILMKPMLDVLKQSHFIYTVPTEAFFTEMKIAFVAGIFASSPYIFYQVWQFVAPGLYSHEKRWIAPIALASALFFTFGAMFGYFVVFPFGFEFFASYTSDILVFTPKLDEYLDFVLKLLFAFGVVFELPLFLFFLARLGLVTHVGLRKKRKYAILVSFVVAAALTPPDAISQTMMAVPLCILYEVGIWVAFFFGKKPKPEPKDEGAEGSAA